MPAYDFFCENCRNEFEIWGTIEEYSKGLAKNCPLCSSDKIEQKLNPLNIVKGGNGGSRGPSCCGPSSGSGCCG